MSLDLPFFPWVTSTQVSSTHVSELTEQQLAYLRAIPIAPLGPEHEERVRKLRGGRIPDVIYDSSSNIYLHRYRTTV